MKMEQSLVERLALKIEVMWPQSKEGRQTSTTRKGKDRFFPRRISNRNSLSIRTETGSLHYQREITRKVISFI
jgi:hypothetical protein